MVSFLFMVLFLKFIYIEIWLLICMLKWLIGVDYIVLIWLLLFVNLIICCEWLFFKIVCIVVELWLNFFGLNKFFRFSLVGVVLSMLVLLINGIIVFK